MTLDVLVIDRAPPTDMRQGNALIAAHVLPLLRDVELTLVAPVTGDMEAERAALGNTFAAIHLVPLRSRVPALTGSLRPVVARRLRRAPAGLRDWLRLDETATLEDAIASVLRSRPWDVIHVRQLPMAGFVPAAPIGRLLELVDSETLATGRRRGPRARIRGIAARAIERRAAATADIVTLVSSVDATAVRRLAPATRVEVVTNGVDTDVFDTAACPDVVESVDEIAFVGAMTFPPNVDAAVWLCRDVLPILRRKRPTATIRLIGRDPVAAVRALASEAVTVTGTVDDVRPEVLRCAVVAIPMVSGSGVKNKVLEAMSMGRPVVSTSMGVESLGVADDREVVIADGAVAFAEALDRLLGDVDRRRRIGRAARAFVIEHHSWATAARRYRELYDDLAALTRSRTAR